VALLLQSFFFLLSFITNLPRKEFLFRNIIDKAIQDGYEPSYYRGITAGSFDYSSFSSGISSGLSSTISSASTPPSESSGGSGGGGSSGGGGGGGGGGGW
jgi:uncharacterized membrane protein